MQCISSVFTFVCILTILHHINGNGENNSTVKKEVDIRNERYFFVHVVDVQETPPAPVITSKSRTSKSNKYFLSWQPGSNITFVESYKIRYRKSLDSLWKYATVAANSTKLLLHNLESSTLYEVEMIELLVGDRISQLAMSSFRTGNSKRPFSDKPKFNSTFVFPLFPPMPPKDGNDRGNHRNSNNTNSALVPDAPSLPFVTDTSPTSISLTWHPRSNGGSPITGYKIQVRTTGSRRSKWKTRKEIVSADTRTYNIDKLKRGLSYKFRIIAINAIGESPPSQSTRPHVTNSHPLRKPTLAPLITNVVAENGSLRILWQYKGPHASSLDGFILKYSTGKKWRKRRLKSGSVSSFKIAKPIYDVMYSVKVQAYNGIGNSPESRPVKFVVVHNSDKGRDEILFEKFLDLSRHSNDETAYEETVDSDDGSHYVPVHNAKVKAHSSQRDIAFIIAGAVLGVVIIILVITVIIYHKTRALQAKNTKAGAVQNNADANANLCSKVLAILCCRERSGSPGHPQVPPSPPAQCGCCSGAASPLLVPGSHLQSNRTSLSQAAALAGEMPSRSPVPGDSVCAVYYDYLSGRFPPFCPPAKSPLWWVREGEFCHIIPHDAKPKLKPGDELIVQSTEERPDDTDNGTPRSGVSVRSCSRNLSEVEAESQATEQGSGASVVDENDGPCESDV